MSDTEEIPGYRGGWCIHYRMKPGLKSDTTCKAGVEYASVRGPGQPCFLTKGESRPGATECPNLRRPTADEMAVREEWQTKRTEQLFAALAAVGPWRSKHKGRSHSEAIECPVCKGRLHPSISSYNSHVHGHCETKGCVSWME